MKQVTKPFINPELKKKSVGIRLSPYVIKCMRDNEINNISAFIEGLIIKKLKIKAK